MTLIRMVEPSLRVLTTTPSMAPSSMEVTLPVSTASAARASESAPSARQTAVVAITEMRRMGFDLLADFASAAPRTCRRGPDRLQCYFHSLIGRGRRQCRFRLGDTDTSPDASQ